MIKIDSVLVAIDENCLGEGNKLPVEVAKSLRLINDKETTELHLFTAAYQKYLHHDFSSLGFNQIQRRREYCDLLSKNLDELAGVLRSKGYQVTSDVAWAYPRYEAVIAKAKAVAADLVVQHTRSYGKVELHHLSNDSWQLVRYCPIPVMLVKNQPWQEEPVLIAAVDPMHSHNKPLNLDTKIMCSSGALAERLTGTLHVVHGYAEAARPFAPAGVIESEHRKAFDQLLSGYSVTPEHLHFLDEPPIIALQQEIDALKADMLVMGALSRSRLSEMLIGSTAEKVLDFLKTDVFIVKP